VSDRDSGHEVAAFLLEDDGAGHDVVEVKFDELHDRAIWVVQGRHGDGGFFDGRAMIMELKEDDDAKNLGGCFEEVGRQPFVVDDGLGSILVQP
jgi:hypothetical protein